MKKIIFFICSCPLFFFSCSSAKEDASFQKIEYNASTRGYSTQILIQEDTLQNFKNNKEISSLILTKKMKNTLNSFLEEIDVTILDQLKASSEKHQYDGAMYSTIEIVWNGKTYKTVGFDDDNPPKKLNPFLNYLHGLIK
tara:strand:+ start:2555 stop:2974 length:420 start_codon:yes stop_codon:yes gene_type:complete